MADALRQYGMRMIPVHRDRSFDHYWLCQTVRRFQTFLLQSYASVLFAEVDEFVLADPQHCPSLTEFIAAETRPLVRCLGLNVLHLHDREPPLDFTRAILPQRSTCYVSALYCKSLLARVPVSWQPGFHSADGEEIAPDPRLLLLHLHRADYDYCRRRHEASAKRRWNERDLQEGRGLQNRIFEPAEFHQWFYHGSDLGEQRCELPARLKTLY